MLSMSPTGCQYELSASKPMTGVKVVTPGTISGLKSMPHSNNVPLSAAHWSMTLKVQMPFNGHPSKSHKSPHGR